MADRFVDVDIGPEAAEQLDRIAAAPRDDVGAVFAAVGLDVSPLLAFLRELSREERLTVVHALVGVADTPDRDADVLAFEAGMLGQGFHALTTLQRRLLALAATLPPAQARELLDITWGVHTTTGATRTGAVFVLARLARLAGVGHGGVLKIGARLEVGRHEEDELKHEIVAARNASKLSPSPAVLFAPRNASGFTLELLEPLLKELQEQLPANDVRFIEPPRMRGVGVSPMQSMAVWLPNDDSTSGSSLSVVDGVRRWMQALHDANPIRPKQVTFISPYGQLLRVLKWEKNKSEPEDIVTRDAGAPQERPDD